MMNNVVEDWKKYQAGIEYNQSLQINGRGYYETLDAVRAFIGGDQWRNSKATDLPKPVFNILQPIEAFKVANIASTSIKVKFEPIEYREDGSMDTEIVASEILTSEVNAVFDDFGLDSKQRELLADGFETGDYGLHNIFNPKAKLYEGKKGNYKGKIRLEIIDGQNVIYGNPNCQDKEKQPWIGVIGRDLVTNLQEEAITKDNIEADLDYTYMAGDNGKLEIKGDKEGKALYILIYKREKNGLISVSKCTQTAYIYKDVKMGLSHYPVILGNWSKTKSCYHGTGGASGVLPNQVELNVLFAMYMYHTRLTAFPTLIYDTKAMGGAWTSQIGVPVGLNLEQGQRIEDAARYLQTGAIATSIQSILELIRTTTMELMGVNDASLGNVNPDNTSAIIAVQKATAVPLETVRAYFYQFVKEAAISIADMIATNYGTRPIVHETEGQRSLVMYDFSTLKGYATTCTTDIGPSGYYSDVATNTTLTNMLQGGFITILQFLDRIDDSLIPEKQALIDELKGAMQQGSQQDNEAMASFFDSLPPEAQAQLEALPDNQFEEAVKALMEQQGGAVPNGAMDQDNT